MDTEQTSKLVERWQTIKATTSLEKRKFRDKLLRKKKTKEQNTKYAAVEQVEQAQLLILETKKPEWSEKLNAWTLNFNGRVKQPSKRNFMLVIDQTDQVLVNEYVFMIHFLVPIQSYILTMPVHSIVILTCLYSFSFAFQLQVRSKKTTVAVWESEQRSVRVGLCVSFVTRTSHGHCLDYICTKIDGDVERVRRSRV